MRAETFKSVLSFGFLVASLTVGMIGLYGYLHEDTKITHFSDVAVKEENSVLKTQVFLVGEFKTKGGGFIAGKKISIYALLLLNEELYQELKDFYEFSPKIVIIKNSEDPEEAGKDIGEIFEQGDLENFFVNPGTLNVEFVDESNAIKLRGDVIFTKEGELSFGLPIGPILESYGITPAISVAPRYVEHQIEANKRMELLSFITVAVALLALFLASFSSFRKSKSGADRSENSTI